MNNNVEQIVIILVITAVVLTVVLLVLFFALVHLKIKQNKPKKESDKTENSEQEEPIKKSSDGYNKQSIFDFMEFEKIEDNMIVQKKCRKYLMIIECQGINFDLMSEIEKNSVEMGFWQFLNTLRHPIQIYVQTRTLNLERSIANYKKRFQEIEDKYKYMEQQYAFKLANGDKTENLEQDFYNLTKQRNLYEYGKDIIDNTEKMSQNRNVLSKKYYIIVPYYNDEKDELYEEEIRSLAFSELYSKSISIIRSLAPTGVTGKILSSNELVELLYIAYNRDETETFGLSRALEAKYDELYTTAPDVLDKKINLLYKEVEKQSVQRINDKLEDINRSKKEREADELFENLEQIVRKQILEKLEQNKRAIGEQTAQEAIEEFQKEFAENDSKKAKKEGGIENNVEEKKTTRGRKKRTV